ncbi:hypothetical protein [Novosphingobium sp.]|uniref:hypothetical protein n=1 Tax=Novosphingobium sp. TaxID=1874826 RepID=UPI0025CDA6CC|nr:hypothetical protein [Novosphingobium sp.]MCC6927090.1 hypothetical protein [Novosphingobium sp.]
MDLAPDQQLVPLRQRDDGWTAQRQRDFLEALAACGSVSKAALNVGMSRESAYALRRRADARGFAQAWDAARAMAVEHLTEVAWDRALEGEVRQVYYHGELVGETRHFDNRLLLALIAQNRALLAGHRAGPALASPALVAEVAADWEAALDRAERGEALVEPEAARAAVPGADSRTSDEAQRLEIGLFDHWWDEAGERWLTNWPAPEGFTGAEFWINQQGEVIAAYDPDADPVEDSYGRPIERDWARELSDEELAGIEQAAEDEEEVRAARIDLYRRAAFGLASKAERTALAAANGGRIGVRTAGGG